MTDMALLEKLDSAKEYIWDVYKTINGIRPRWMNLDGMSLDDLEAVCDDLARALIDHEEHLQASEAIAVVKFENLVKSTIESGAGDRETAIRWLREGLGELNITDGFLCYEYGLPYNYKLVLP
jgi:hypothetical protein